MSEKIIVYQLVPRLFGNTNRSNKTGGTLAENGSGKFSSLNEAAIDSLKELGVTHVWLTGVLEHATRTDYTAYGIPLDHPQVVKGQAGSPYAIKDYYDVSPELADSVPDRLAEFEACVQRLKNNGLRVLIDLVPNHVARNYHSDAKPVGVRDFGANDNNKLAFAPNNNFYYLPGHVLKLPAELYQVPAPKPYDEYPAKATGNDCFRADPQITDWYETVKLNFGVDYMEGSIHFEPVPDTWTKLKDIVLYWAAKGINGFRCDMVELTPVAFWEWLIPQVRQQFPHLIFIAEVYNPSGYSDYLYKGHFDFLYDKAGMYDTLRAVVEGHASANDLCGVLWKSSALQQYMLRFVENHDEHRVASSFFAQDPWMGIPATAFCYFAGPGPAMIYMGQELGVDGSGDEGFSGEDGKTTIFDYWCMPELANWYNEGQCDGALLEGWQKDLRAEYARLGKLARLNKAFADGALYDLQPANQGKSFDYNDHKLYAFLRHNAGQKLLVLINFDREAKVNPSVKIPLHAWATMGLEADHNYLFRELSDRVEPILCHGLKTSNTDEVKSGVPCSIGPKQVLVFEIVAV